jgi:hypothetical protein
MTPEAVELAKDALHFLYAAGCVFLALVGLLVKASYTAGVTLTQVKDALKDLPDIKAKVDKLPIIEHRLATVEQRHHPLRDSANGHHVGE